ncbi:MAG: hypothetical protein ABSA97_08830 [Verrucomicrobiia bacterium]
MGTNPKHEYPATAGSCVPAISAWAASSDPKSSMSSARSAAIIASTPSACSANRPAPHRKRPGPKPLYDGAVAAVFKALWLATDQLCSKRLKAVLPLWLPYCVVFCPSMKLVSKKRVKARLVKKHDPPHTPYERLLATPQVSKDKKRQLRERFAQLNPFELKKNIERN